MQKGKMIFFLMNDNICLANNKRNKQNFVDTNENAHSYKINKLCNDKMAYFLTSLLHFVPTLYTYIHHKNEVTLPTAIPDMKYVDPLFHCLFCHIITMYLF